MHRNWQNGRLWWNDPDAVCLTGDLSDNEFLFHATAAYASGGMILSGDDLTKMPPGKLAILRKLIPATGQAAAFTNAEPNLGIIQLPGEMMVCLFNPSDEDRQIEVHLSRRYHITDYWNDEDLGNHDGSYQVKTAPRSARLLRCV
jgi:alpha-galactosidase